MAKINRKIPLVTIFLGLFLPVLIVLVSIFIFFPFKFILPSFSGGEVQDQVITPKSILSAKSQYNGKLVTVRGKLNYEPVVCQKMECPVQDKCCGCPQERRLSLLEPQSNLSQGTLSFPIVDTDNTPFCQRIENSCDYDCQGWKEGQTYDVSGKFYSQSPPPGWKLSLDYYFVATSKEPVSGISLGSPVGNLFQNIKKFFSSLSGEGSYVLP